MNVLVIVMPFAQTFQWIFYAFDLYFVEVVLNFCKVATWFEEFVKTSYIIFQENRFIFEGVINCILCIFLFYMTCINLIYL